MNDINDIYKMLNWENPPEVQLQGIHLAQQISDLSQLIQPSAEPSVWEHCARILAEKPDDVLVPYLHGLLEWLRDLNWPGAVIILERLKTFSGGKLKKSFIECFTYAVNLNNVEGVLYLSSLSELLDNEELKAELPEEILKNLQKYYHNGTVSHSD